MEDLIFSLKVTIVLLRSPNEYKERSNGHLRREFVCIGENLLSACSDCLDDDWTLNVKIARTWLQLRHFIMSHTQQVQSYFRCNKESAKNDSKIQGQFDNLCEWIE